MSRNPARLIARTLLVLSLGGQRPLTESIEGEQRHCVPLLLFFANFVVRGMTTDKKYSFQTCLKKAQARLIQFLKGAVIRG